MKTEKMSHSNTVGLPEQAAALFFRAVVFLKPAFGYVNQRASLVLCRDRRLLSIFGHFGPQPTLINQFMLLLCHRLNALRFYLNNL